MIPLSPRKRERERLAPLTFGFDDTTVERLEAAVCAHHDYRFAVAFNTPESALLAALEAEGITAGDTLLTGAMAPLHHYTAAARLQAALHYCDIGLDGNLYGKAIEALLPSTPKAVLYFAFEGIRDNLQPLPATITPIQDLSASLAQAERSCTTLWSMESLMPEGLEKTGFVLTDNAEAAARMKFYRAQGRKQGSLWNYDLLAAGTDGALSAASAAVALKQMVLIHDACDRRREHAGKLDELLRGNSLFDTIKRSPESVLRSYPILLTPQLYCPKEDIFTAIEAKGVEVSVCCKPVYKTAAFRDDGIRLTVTEDFYKALLQLPCHHLLSAAEIETVAATVREAVEVYAYRGCRF